VKNCRFFSVGQVNCELANGASSDSYHNMTTVLENHNNGN
jgi:hypothetical protein